MLDVYGELLSERKRELIELYYGEDYSLAEIAELTGISRQGVRDSVKKTVLELHEWEGKLHMAERLRKEEDRLRFLAQGLEDALALTADETVRGKLTALLAAVQEMETGK